MKRLWAIGLAGVLGWSLVSCSARTTAKRNVNLGAIASNDVSLATMETKSSFPSPLVTPAQGVPKKPATRNLTPPNVPPIGTVGVGDRPDPFVALPMPVTIIRKPATRSTATQSIATQSIATQSIATQSIATQSIATQSTVIPSHSTSSKITIPAVPPAPPAIVPVSTVVIPAVNSASLNPANQIAITSRQQPMVNGSSNQNQNAIENAQQNPIGMVPPIPTLPSRSMAESIEISGVIHVGDKPRIIVQVPNERSSRTVSVGDVLANGQVRVSRVILNNGSDPYVVLEQNGKEVMRSIGGT